MTSIVDKADWLVERPDGLLRLCRSEADGNSSLVLGGGRYSFFVETSSTETGVFMCTRLGVAEVLDRRLAFTFPNGGGEDVVSVNTWERLKIRRGAPSPCLKPGQLEFVKSDEPGDDVVIWLLSAVDVQNELSVVSAKHPVRFAFSRVEGQESRWVVSQGGGKNDLLYDVSQPVVSSKPGCPNGTVLRRQEVSEDGDGEGARARMEVSRNGPPF